METNSVESVVFNIICAYGKTSSVSLGVLEIQCANFETCHKAPAKENITLFLV